MNQYATDASRAGKPFDILHTAEAVGFLVGILWFTT
ncbi:hypothetical protein SAMN04489842_2711 [Natronobacterium texcoconense]|uniref:Uncharacterized protein n=1 Tax=Natronobacterium texcoconense TaxID=1095778 RepID=A0A1H1GZT2_NATTX|nr:hypothetical protein SAMN04489842_2711 [Natronobacterium texcoconense]